MVKPSLGGCHGGLGVVLGSGKLMLLFTWQCFAPEGPHLPSMWVRFLYCFDSFWRWLCWPSISKGKMKESVMLRCLDELFEKTKVKPKDVGVLVVNGPSDIWITYEVLFFSFVFSFFNVY